MLLLRGTLECLNQSPCPLNLSSSSECATAAPKGYRRLPSINSTWSYRIHVRKPARAAVEFSPSGSCWSWAAAGFFWIFCWNCRVQITAQMLLRRRWAAWFLGEWRLDTGHQRFVLYVAYLHNNILLFIFLDKQPSWIIGKECLLMPEGIIIMPYIYSNVQFSLGMQTLTPLWHGCCSGCV
jgi:hypothetical protein